MAWRADGRISIMAGSGVNAGNAAELIRRTGISEVHGSCSRPVAEVDPRVAALGFSDPKARATVAEEVAALFAAVNS
jgi:copper homeostasis protein